MCYIFTGLRQLSHLPIGNDPVRYGERKQVCPLWEHELTAKGQHGVHIDTDFDPDTGGLPFSHPLSAMDTPNALQGNHL